MPRPATQVTTFALLAVLLNTISAVVLAQVKQGAIPARKGTQVTVRAVRVLQEKEGAALEISSNGALVPTITKLDGPPRLVIDLPGAVNAVSPKPIRGGSGEIKAVRVSQFRNMPPLTRVVVDLSEASSYSWRTEPDKLVVRLRRAEPEPGPGPEPAKVAAPLFSRGVQPIITGASGTIGTVVNTGGGSETSSSLTAGQQTAVLNLARGGQIRVCPGTTVSVTSSQNGRDLMLGMSTGAVEAHYSLSASADSILTPDFRILLPGPGEFHYAVSADSKGNTCVRALPGNSAPAIVSELMGEGTYQVKPSDELVFHAGQLTNVGRTVPLDCGCPEAQVPVMRAEAAPPVAAPENASATGLPITMAAGRRLTGAPVQPPTLEENSKPYPAQIRVSVTPEQSKALPIAQSGEVHVQVDVPLVYRARDTVPVAAEEVRQLPVVSAPTAEPMRVLVLPPPANKPKPRGFFGRVKRFFVAVFG